MAPAWCGILGMLPLIGMPVVILIYFFIGMAKRNVEHRENQKVEQAMAEMCTTMMPKMKEGE